MVPEELIRPEPRIRSTDQNFIHKHNDLYDPAERLQNWGSGSIGPPGDSGYHCDVTEPKQNHLHCQWSAIRETNLNVEAGYHNVSSGRNDGQVLTADPILHADHLTWKRNQLQSQGMTSTTIWKNLEYPGKVRINIIKHAGCSLIVLVSCLGGRCYSRREGENSQGRLVLVALGQCS